MHALKAEGLEAEERPYLVPMSFRAASLKV